MMRGDLCFLDTNILLSATDEGRIDHQECQQVFRRAIERGIHLAVSGQVICEYLSVSTRDRTINGLGLSPEDAVRNVAEFRRRTLLLEETEPVNDQLRLLVSEFGVTGAHVHDANVAATMIVHHVKMLVTENTTDFRDFTSIDVVAPVEFVAP